MDKILLRSDQDRIAILTFNSPKNLNALSEAMLEALKLNLEEIGESKLMKGKDRAGVTLTFWLWFLNILPWHQSPPSPIFH